MQICRIYITAKSTSKAFFANVTFEIQVMSDTIIIPKRFSMQLMNIGSQENIHVFITTSWMINRERERESLRSQTFLRKGWMGDDLAKVFL